MGTIDSTYRGEIKVSVLLLFFNQEFMVTTQVARIQNTEFRIQESG